MIYSKSIFKRNQDVAQFLENTFNIKYKDYIISSRTLIAANVTQWLLGSENFMYKKELINFINIKIEELKENEEIKEKKNNFDGWIS